MVKAQLVLAQSEWFSRHYCTDGMLPYLQVDAVEAFGSEVRTDDWAANSAKANKELKIVFEAARLDEDKRSIQPSDDYFKACMESSQERIAQQYKTTFGNLARAKKKSSS